MIKWRGKSTSGLSKWTETAETMKELYQKLVDRDIISIVDDDPEMRYVIERAGLSYSKVTDELADAADENGTDFMAAYEKFLKDNGIDDVISEDEYQSIIYHSDGNAYYQEFEIE